MALRTAAGGSPTGSLMAIIGDEDTVTGVLLAGVGDVNDRKEANFLIVFHKTPTSVIEEAFHRYTARQDIAVVLINQTIAERIRNIIDEYRQTIPSIVEIPSKETPYDITRDSLMSRVLRLLPENLRT